MKKMQLKKLSKGVLCLMKTETIISFIILILCISPVFVLGIVQYRSKRVVGFWSGEEPPKNEWVTDMKAYNYRHCIMWILYGTGFVVCYMFGFLWGAIVAAVLCVAECIAGIFIMVICHKKWYGIYVKK